MKIQILLVDDQKIFRHELTSFLNQNDEIIVVGEAEDGKNAIELAQELKPDIVVMDINAPRLNGINAACDIISQNPQIKIITLSEIQNEYFVDEMFNVGALAYIIKEFVFEEIILAIESVSKGKKYLCSKITETIFTNYIESLYESNKKKSKVLSTLDKKILYLKAQGKSDKKINLELHIKNSPIQNIINKLIQNPQFKNVSELLKTAALSTALRSQKLQLSSFLQ